MIKSIVWFTCGGLFTACYANAVRNFPIFRRPSMHVVYTLIGFGLGYKFHRFEETSDDVYKHMIEKHKNAPWYPQGVLLAERAARHRALLEGAEGVEAVAIEDEFVDDEEDDTEEEE